MKVNFMKFKDVLNLVLCEERDIGSFVFMFGIKNRINKINCEKPNYRFLLAVSSSKTGRNNKHKR